jgi:hypothetical protein
MNQQVNFDTHHGQIPTHRVVVTLVAWVLSLVAAFFSSTLAFRSLFHHHPIGWPTNFGMSDELHSVFVLFAWIALIVMNAGWILNKQVHWVWPIFGSVCGLTITPSYFKYWMFFAASFLLAVHLVLFHLVYHRKKVNQLMTLLVSTLASVTLYFSMWTASESYWMGFNHEPLKIPTHEKQKSFVIGDLGGMLVKIPSHFIKLVEYNGDSEWIHTADGKHESPPRTQDSKLMHFEFDVRYPDMVTRSTLELERDYQKTPSYKTKWIRVEVRAGKLFQDADFLSKMVKRINEPPASFQYIELTQDAQSIDGLTLLAAEGINPKNKIPHRFNHYADDIYIAHHQDKRVSAYINCSNSPVESAPCRHEFSLEPDAKGAISLSYRRELISEWKPIQNSLRNLILNFRSAP